MKNSLSVRRSNHNISALVSGLDVPKEYTCNRPGPRRGVVAWGRMPNKEAPAFLKPYLVERAAMEAITSIAPLYRRLREEGYQATVSHPKKTRHIAEARIKTDRFDSRALAELLRVNSLPESYVPPPSIRIVRVVGGFFSRLGSSVGYSQFSGRFFSSYSLWSPQLSSLLRLSGIRGTCRLNCVACPQHVRPENA